MSYFKWCLEFNDPKPVTPQIWIISAGLLWDALESPKQKSQLRQGVSQRNALQRVPSCCCARKVEHWWPSVCLPTPSTVIRVTTQARSLKNTVATVVFVYQKQMGLEVFCLFLESTRFPKETARLFSMTPRLRLNIFHTNFFPANGVVTTQAAKPPLSSCPSCQRQQRVSGGTDHTLRREAGCSTLPLSFFNEVEQIRSKSYLYLTVQSTQCPK